MLRVMTDVCHSLRCLILWVILYVICGDGVSSSPPHGLDPVVSESSWGVKWLRVLGV